MTYTGHKINAFFEDDWHEFEKRYSDTDAVTASIVWAMAYPIGALKVPTQTWHNAERMIERKIAENCPTYILGGDLYETYRNEFLVANNMLLIPEEVEEPAQEVAPEEPQRNDDSVLPYMLTIEQLNELVRRCGKPYIRDGKEYTGIEHIDIVLRMYDAK